MLYQYQCACCNKVVTANDKECQHCGSHHIRSPYGFWIFCVFACLMVAITFKVGQIYLNNHQTDTPEQITLLNVLNQDSNKADH